MTDPGWVVTPKESPAALHEGFVAEPFVATEVASEQPELTDPTSLRNDPFLVPILEKLDQASLETLSRILGGWPISPDD